MRRDVAADAHLHLLIDTDVEIEIEIEVLAVVHRLRNDLLDLRIREHLEIGALELLHRELPVDIAVQLLLDIAPLRARDTRDVDILEHQFGQAGAIGAAPGVDLREGDTPRDALTDGVDHPQCAPIALIHQLLGAGKVEQVDVRELELNHHAVILRDVVFRATHHHRLDLFHKVGRGVGRTGHGGAEDEVGVKFGLDNIHGEVVVDAAVEEWDAIFPNRLEKEGERHRGAHRLAQIAVAPDDSFLVIDVGADAAEGHEKVVEIPARLRRGGCIEGHKRLIHLYRVDEALRQQVGDDLQRIGEVDGEAHKVWRGVGLLEIVDILVLHAARLPVSKLVGKEQSKHLVGRIADGVKAPDDGANGRAGDVVNGDFVFLQGLDHAQVCGALRPAAAQHEAHRLLLRRAVYGRQRRQHQQGGLHEFLHSIHI